MDKDEKEYREKMLKEGVEVPELEEKPEEVPEETPEEPKEPEKDTAEPKPEPLQETKEKKRSIYDDFKDNKKELKSTKETLARVEAERDEWKSKVDNLNNANTPEEKKEAQDEIDEFAQSINADPEAIRRMQALFQKSMKPFVDPALKKDLEDFKAYKEQNQGAIKKQKFDDSFTKAKPALKDLFPTANSDELETIKTELSELIQEDKYKDKDLDYVAFKNKTVLSALVSPRKKGMETKGRQQGAEVISADFDPTADFAKMSSAQQEEWLKNYERVTKTNSKDDSLYSDADGKLRIL